jgi:hypothetical protein
MTIQVEYNLLRWSLSSGSGESGGRRQGTRICAFVPQSDLAEAEVSLGMGETATERGREGGRSEAAVT